MNWYSIVFLETIANGLRLYRFQYLCSDQVYVGVMAQELIDTHPEALSKGSNGFYSVDYSVLGLEMLTLEEWVKKQEASNLLIH